MPDGIYGEETISAVKAFQEDDGLPITGEVDEATWNALVASYYATLAPITAPVAIGPFPSPRYLLGKNDSGNLVFIAQVLLNEISENLPETIKLPVNGQFDERTENAVKSFQRASLLPPTGKLDRETWDRLAKIYSNSVKA